MSLEKGAASLILLLIITLCFSGYAAYKISTQDDDPDEFLESPEK